VCVFVCVCVCVCARARVSLTFSFSAACASSLVVSFSWVSTSVVSSLAVGNPSVSRSRYGLRPGGSTALSPPPLRTAMTAAWEAWPDDTAVVHTRLQLDAWTISSALRSQDQVHTRVRAQMWSPHPSTINGCGLGVDSMWTKKI
jgi:hypothetical protein